VLHVGGTFDEESAGNQSSKFRSEMKPPPTRPPSMQGLARAFEAGRFHDAEYLNLADPNGSPTLTITTPMLTTLLEVSQKQTDGVSDAVSALGAKKQVRV
jgi:hypothetical protein